VAAAPTHRSIAKLGARTLAENLAHREVDAMAPIEHIRVEANGVDFHVAVSGPSDAPAVLCLHGFPEGWMSWRAIMGMLDDVRIYAPDMRGYPGTVGGDRSYDVFTLTDDVRQLIKALDLQRPTLVGHDWGAELGWVFGHRYSDAIDHLVVVNGTHPRTLTRAIVHCDDLQTVRVPWVYFFEIPRFPEWLMSTGVGRRMLRWSFLVREGKPGRMNRALVQELVDRFQAPSDVFGPIGYYRGFVATLRDTEARQRLEDLYRSPIQVPVTAIWGLKDGALPIKVAMESGRDAGRDVEWRPLPGVGHFVSLEAPELLAAEISRVRHTAARAI
jgi:pimeloyl-ACP methyl ester carboxylesterase